MDAYKLRVELTLSLEVSVESTSFTDAIDEAIKECRACGDIVNVNAEKII